MKKMIYIISVVILALAQSACVREFPGLNPDGSEGVDPTLVTVDVALSLDLSLEPLVPVHHFRSESEPMMRFVVEFARDGVVVERVETFVDPSTVSQGKLELPLSVKLHALEYNVAVWGDFVDGSSHEPLCYDSSNLYAVSCLRPYAGCMDERQCFCGVTALDLRPWRNQWNASVTVPVELRRPQAKYRIIATDVDEFLSRGTKARGGYTVKFRYGIMPWQYDAWAGTIDGYMDGMDFTVPLELSTASDGTVQMGFDWLFAVNNISEVRLSLTLFDEYLVPVSHVTDIAVPLQRGKLTTITGDFLTNEVGGAISIDTEWAGTVEIDAEVSY